MKRNYQQPATSVAQVNFQPLLLDIISPAGGPNGINAIRTAYGTNPEEIWD